MTSWSQSYKVRFWNPETGKGLIESYSRAAHAKTAAEKCNALYEKEGNGIRAEYLGKPKNES